MGQQQLLLLLLTIVITGLAGAVGIDAFERGQQKARLDAIQMEAVSTSSQVLAWKAASPAMGGGSESRYLEGFSWAVLGFDGQDSRGQLYVDALDLRYYYPPFGLRSRGVRFNVLDHDMGIGVAFFVYGDSAECIQYTPMHDRGSGRHWGGGYELDDESWEDAGTIPASCPDTW